MTRRPAIHERLTGDEHRMVMISNRRFGIIFTIVFTVIALLPYMFSGTARWWVFSFGGPILGWFLAIAAVLLLVALVRPSLLYLLNFVWFKVVLVLSWIVSFVAMALLFYGVVTPTGLIMRILRKDLLKLRYDKDTDSYWIHRDPPGPDPDSMKNQF